MNIIVDTDIKVPQRFLQSNQLRWIYAAISEFTDRGTDYMSQARRCVRAMEIYAERRRHDDDYPMEIAVLTRSKCDFVKPYICQKVQT